MENFSAQPPVKLLRAPNLKRGKPDDRITDRIKLERVLGVTVNSNAALASDPNSETVAYPAGCTVVLFNTTTGQQSHIINTSKKSVAAIAFSSCGRYLVTGECGHQPAVRIWDLQSDPTQGHSGLSPQIQQIAEFTGHKYGISCVAFSPTNKYVVSVGTQHDMIVNVWDWKSNVKVASNKVSTKVKSIAFAENGSYFVTVGNRHVKFWFLEYGKSKYNKEAVPLMGRSAILGEQRNNYFCDVACGKAQCGDSTYAITRSGLLCEFNNRRLLDKWVELRTSSANCISVGEQFIFVGCADGLVRCFDPVTLKFITTLPRTHYLGVDVSLGLNITHMSSPPKEAKYPDTTAITYDESSNKLTCIYNDHSVYVWDVHNIKRVGKSHSFLYHSACIWGVEMVPPQSPLPAGSFLTCSSDDTIRVWSLDKLTDKTAKGMYRRNIYSNELLKVVYVDKEHMFLKDLDVSGSNVSNEKQDSSYDGRNGVRSIRVSPDGKHLASGDRAGNIRIHETTSMAELLTIEAHDAEVLCLEFSNPTDSNGNHKLLASASRDRLIHVFDVNGDYNFLQTLDDHSSSITAVRFLTSTHGNLQMVSCGADKSLIFRSLGGTPNGTPQFQRGHNATGKTTLYDMEVDAGQKHVLTACQDRNVRIYSVGTGKHTKSFKGSTGDDGTLIKVVLDKSGIYLATSCTDKTLSVYDYYTGECMATMCGHSELVTGLRFTNDCRRLISASGDGCIFVWRVPHDMVVTMHARLSQQAMRQGKTLDNEIFSDSSNVDFYDASTSVDNDYRFSIGQLPLWAKKHISDDTGPAPAPLPKGVAAPKGRWAQRAERSVGVKSFYTDSVIPFPTMQGSDGSKDSSLDSTVEVRQYSERRESTGISKQDNEFMTCEESYHEISSSVRETSSSSVTVTRGEHRRNFTDDRTIESFRDPDMESTAHDGDIDSDQEYRHQPLYYPTHIDSASGSEFTVTNMDADELRRSVRRSKKSTPPTINLQPASISTGSQESEDDDDEVSTPSGENTDRNPLSMLSVSSESLDQIVNREKYLQSTFESLSGAEMDSPVNKSSISSRYHTQTGSTPKLRNMAVINAAKLTKNDSETLKKREELQKRIADTKKKLQNIGYNSPLKYSQSIVDLSHIPEKDNKWSRKTGNDSQSASGCPCSNDQLNKNDFPHANNNTANATGSLFDDNSCSGPRTSASLPADLQLCGCYMREITKNTTDISNLLRPPPSARLSDILTRSTEERKLKLDKTLNKYKLHKSLPVSPVSEECRLADFAAAHSAQHERKSFSYFIDLNEQNNTNEGFKKICDDIEKFSQDFSRNYQQIEDIFKEKTSGECFINSGRGFVKSRSDFGFLQLEKEPDNSLFNPPDNLENKTVTANAIVKSNSDFGVSSSGYVNEAFMYSGKFECDSLEPFVNTRKTVKGNCKGRNLHKNDAQNNARSKKITREISGRKAEMWVKENVNQTSDFLNYDKEIADYENVQFYEPGEDEEGNFSSDSLEDCSFKSVRNTKWRKNVPPRRCVSNNELYKLQAEEKETDYSKYFHHGYDCEMPKSESFYLNQSHRNSQESILSSEDNLLEDDYAYRKSRSYCNSLESVLSNESDCKSAPLEILFASHRATYSQSLPKSRSTTCDLDDPLSKSYGCQMDVRRSRSLYYNEKPKVALRTSQTQTDFDFETPEEKVLKKSNISAEFQQKLLKFESCIAQNDLKSNLNKQPNKGIAFFVKAEKLEKPRKENVMYIPSLESKNLQYKSKFCNILNNKPETNMEIFQVGTKRPENSSFTLTTHNFDRSRKNKIQETASLDRHLLAKGLLGAEKICHKPPKAVRRHSSKTRKKRTSYEYVKKEDLVKDTKNLNNSRNVEKHSGDENAPPNETGSNERSIEFNYKEKNVEKDLENANFITELYDSLDKRAVNTKMDLDSLEYDVNIDRKKENTDRKQLWRTSSCSDVIKVQIAIDNIKILNEIQMKINTINTLVDVFRQNLSVGKVRALSSMYENLNKPRERIPSLTNIGEGVSRVDTNSLNNAKIVKNVENRVHKNELGHSEVRIDDDNPDSSLRRACSLSDLSVQGPIVPKRKVDQVSGKVAAPRNPQVARVSRYVKSSAPMMRSSSTGVLNQSDSDDGEKKSQSRLMRPTISSQNKVAANGSSGGGKSATIRKRHSHSVMNLSSVGQEDSSSEELEKPLPTKPIVPPRTRLHNSDSIGPTSARRHTNNVKEKPKIMRNSSYDNPKKMEHDSTITTNFDDSIDVDFSTVQLSTQLCDEVALQLTKAANNVVELYRRLTDPNDRTGHDGTAVQKTGMVKNLELSIATTQKLLQDITLEKFRQNNSDVDVNQTDTVKKLNDLISKGFTNDQNTIVNVMQKYSDILLGMMQQKMQGSNT